VVKDTLANPQFPSHKVLASLLWPIIRISWRDHCVDDPRLVGHERDDLAGDGGSVLDDLL
jgi:hypothetical protein